MRPTIASRNGPSSRLPHRRGACVRACRMRRRRGFREPGSGLWKRRGGRLVHMGAAGGEPLRNARRRRIDTVREQRRPPAGQLVIRADRPAGALRFLRLYTADRRRHRLCRGPAQQRLRTRPRDRQRALGQALRRAQRRTQRARARRRPHLWGDRRRRVRAVAINREAALGPPPHERHAAVRRCRAGLLERTRVPQHGRVRPAGAR